MADLTTFIDGLPKAELHLHIEGTLEPELQVRPRRAATASSLPYASVEEMRAAYTFHDLTSFLRRLLPGACRCC